MKPLTVRIERPSKLPYSARVYGVVRAVVPALDESGCPWMYEGRLHCFLVPRDKRLDDLLAALDAAGHVVVVDGPGWT